MRTARTKPASATDTSHLRVLGFTSSHYEVAKDKVRAMDEQLALAPALDVDAVRTVQIGTLLWAVALVALLPFRADLADSGRTWWLWTCAAGITLGSFGVLITTRRRRRLQRAR